MKPMGFSYHILELNEDMILPFYLGAEIVPFDKISIIRSKATFLLCILEKIKVER